MKITKRQLRRIIKEMHPRAEVDNDIFDYEEWARERGSPPSASSVIASYFISIGNWSAPDMQMLGDHYGIAAEDIQREIKIQREEMAAGGLSQEVPEASPGSRPGEHKLDFGKDIGTYNYRNEGIKMKITKRQLRRIIKEERIKLLREYDEADAAPPTNGEHHWPRVDWSNVGELVDKWAKMEEDAWDTGDTSMNPDDISNADAKREWGHQVENGAMDMEAELTLRIRKVALQTMQEFTDKLINGEYV